MFRSRCSQRALGHDAKRSRQIREGATRQEQSPLVYRDTHAGISAQVVFEFANGKLDNVSYMADQPKDPEAAFLTWCLALAKRYGQGIVYLDKKPVASPGVWFWMRA
ncbi:MAG: hypothetical protein ACJ746_08815 [Bryobacteraceae bacterium]